MTIGAVARPARLKAAACFASICLSSAAPGAWAQNGLHLSNEFGVTHNDVTGPGSGQSNLTRGFWYLDQLSLSGNGKVKGFDYNLNLGAKLTDDRNSDIKHFSVTNLQGRVTNRIHTLNAGDTFESFSQYALATSVKGASYRFSREGTRLPELTVLYGYAYPRWDNINWFFARRAEELRTLERAVFGTRVKQPLRDGLWAALSYVSSSDHARPSPAAEAFSNKAVTADWEYRPLAGATVSGEHSFSRQSDSPSAGATDLLRHGAAHKLTAVGDADPSRVTLEYERVSPYYTTVVGAATPDREKFKTTWRYKAAKNVTARTGFLWFHDDLEGQRAVRSDSYKPEAGVAFKKLLGRQYSSADLTYKIDLIVQHDAAAKQDHILNASYRDRFGFVDCDANLGYSDRRLFGASASRQKDYTYNADLGSRHTLGKVILKPAVRLGGWTTRDELAYDTDQIYEYSAGLGVDVPGWKVTSDFKVGRNQLQKTNGDNSSRVFSNAGIYYRPAALEAMQGMLFARLSMNDFRYANGSRDFRETGVTTGLNVQF